MDWIEQYFGLAPDNGDGTVEILIVVGLAIAAIAAAFWRFPSARLAARDMLFMSSPRTREARSKAGRLIGQNAKRRSGPASHRTPPL